jgi:hypothetical protein
MLAFSYVIGRNSIGRNYWALHVIMQRLIYRATGVVVARVREVLCSNISTILAEVRYGFPQFL